MLANLRVMTFDLSTAWLETLVAAAISVVVSLTIVFAGRAVLERIARGRTLMSAVLGKTKWPARFVLPLAALSVVWTSAPDDLKLLGRIEHLNSVLLLAAVTWLAINAVQGVSDGVVQKNPYDAEDNLHSRRILTQTKVLARTVIVTIVLAGGSLILMTFPGARHVGASLLASAGVVGLVVGIAARPLFSNLIAGLQIALAQPIRIDDVLIVDTEWGRVEEITGTYVVLSIWDERRLIIPLQWFIENPFQNWTRNSAEIIGTVFLFVDFAMPLAPLRAEAQRLCEASKDWDRRLCLLQVTEAGEHNLQLRVLVTSTNSSKAWDLRCFVREGLADFMQREYPQHLPNWRGRLDGHLDRHPSDALDQMPAPPPASR